MKRIKTHRLGIDSGSQVLFNDVVNDGVMWIGEGDRDIRAVVAFSDSFIEPPIVTVGLSMWDIDATTNSRVDIRAENVTTIGFEIVFSTWGDTRVARVRADWTALGEVRDDEDWDVS